MELLKSCDTNASKTLQEKILKVWADIYGGAIK